MPGEAHLSFLMLTAEKKAQKQNDIETNVIQTKMDKLQINIKNSSQALVCGITKQAQNIAKGPEG